MHLSQFHGKLRARERDLILTGPGRDCLCCTVVLRYLWHLCARVQHKCASEFSALRRVLVGSWYHPAPVAKPRRPQLYRTTPWARYCDPCLPRMRSDCTVRWPIPIPSRPVFPLFLGRAQLHTAHAPYPRPLPEVFPSPTCHNCPSDTSPRTAIALLFSFCFVGLRTAVLFCFG